MAANIYTGFNVAVAKQTIGFVDAGINSDNIFIIFRIEADKIVSYDPTRGINGISGFEQAKGYYIIAKQQIDLSAIVSTTFSEGGSIGTGAVLLEDGTAMLTQ